MVTSWVVVRCADIRNTTPYPQKLLLRDGNWSLTCGFEVAVGHLTQPASAPGPTTAERVSVEGERLRRALEPEQRPSLPDAAQERRRVVLGHLRQQPAIGDDGAVEVAQEQRSEEHTYELQSLMRNSHAVFCLTTKKTTLISAHNPL